MLFSLVLVSLFLILLSWRTACGARTKVKAETRVSQRGEPKGSLYFGRSAAYRAERQEYENASCKVIELTQKAFLVKWFFPFQHVINRNRILVRQLRSRPTNAVFALKTLRILAHRFYLATVHDDLTHTPLQIGIADLLIT